ncbi:MAG: RDD family protein [Tepidisphaeraceae bacterium]
MGRSGFWIRLAATAIDGIVLLIFVATISVTVDVLEQRGTLTEAKHRVFMAMPYALWLAYSGLEVLVSATPGKMATGIVIALPDGAPAPLWTLVLRWSTKQFGVGMLMLFELTGQPLFYVIGGMVNFMLIIGVLRVLGEEKLAWHDLWSHTAVVPRKVAVQMRNVQEDPQGAPPPT